ncbi:MAG: hypothetical protein ACOZE5_12845 [Verrucomicrobiota bacterium]
MQPRVLSLALTALLLGLTACTYDFPLTDRPTRDIDPRLPGDWVATDEDGKEVPLHVRQYDDSTYVIALDNDLYRAFHTDFAGIAFVSVQNLQSGSLGRKYTYFRWQLSADGAQLTLQSINTEIVPEDTPDRAALQALIKANLTNPKLYNEALTFARPAAPTL